MTVYHTYYDLKVIASVTIGHAYCDFKITTFVTTCYNNYNNRFV